MSERIKPTISGSAETMLQSFYARAQYSKSKQRVIRHRAERGGET